VRGSDGAACRGGGCVSAVVGGKDVVTLTLQWDEHESGHGPDGRWSMTGMTAAVRSVGDRRPDGCRLPQQVVKLLFRGRGTGRGRGQTATGAVPGTNKPVGADDRVQPGVDWDAGGRVNAANIAKVPTCGTAPAWR